MLNNIDLHIARRLLFTRRERFLSVSSWVAMLGVCFGVASLLITLSIVSGFQKEYKKAVLGFNSHLIFLRDDEIENPDVLAKKFSKYETLGKKIDQTPFIYREGMAVAGSRVKGVVLKGVNLEKYISLSHMSLDRMTTIKNKDHLPELFLGKSLAEELKLTEKQDSVLRILFPQGLKPEDSGIKNIKKFFVAGTFESGLYDYDSSFAFLTLAEASKFFQTEGRVSGIEVWLENPDRAEAWAQAMRKDFPFPNTVMTWRELNENIFRALEMEKIVFSILILVLMTVASLNIVSTLMMLLIQRRGEISILKALGCSWKRLRKIFLLDGLLIGSVGTVLGIFLGLVVLLVLKYWQPIPLAPEIYFIRHVPVVFSWVHVVVVVVSSFLISTCGCELALRGISRVDVARTLTES